MPRGYWMKPAYHRSVDGGDCLPGPIQVNWYNRGLRVHLTWPRLKTWTIFQRGPA